MVPCRNCSYAGIDTSSPLVQMYHMLFFIFFFYFFFLFLRKKHDISLSLITVGIESGGKVRAA